MSTIARRKALSLGHWSTEWKRGAVSRGATAAVMGAAMGDELLSVFFARYPSALSSTHLGGRYQIVCPECGHIVSVAMLDEGIDRLSVHCDNCGYADELTTAPRQAIEPAA